MKYLTRLVSAVALGLFAAAECAAQLAMDIDFNRSVFLLNEPIYARLRLRNDSGRTLIFGESQDLRGRLQMEIVGPNGRRFRFPGSGPNPLQGLVLREGQEREVVFELGDYVTLDRTGAYRIYAYAGHPMLTEEFRTPDRRIEITEGLSLWKRTVGIPDLLNTEQQSTPAETRTYELTAVRDGREKRLYLSVYDDRRLYSLVPLGDIGGSDSIRCEIDAYSSLHLLLPVTAKIYEYLKYNSTGGLETRKIYRKSELPPILVRDPETGVVTVAGGEIAVPGVDYMEESAPANPRKPEL